LYDMFLDLCTGGDDEHMFC